MIFAAKRKLPQNVIPIRRKEAPRPKAGATGWIAAIVFLVAYFVFLVWVTK